MNNIVIDTCVLIHIVRDTIAGKKCLEELERYDEAANILISVVTKAELESFIAQNSWGKIKTQKLNKLLEEIIYIDISNADRLLIEAYTEIDAYSKRKIKDKSGNLMKGSAK
jgi:predicted nucleic acid-binding protein